VQTEEAIDDWLDSAWLATTSAVYDATTWWLDSKCHRLQ
jgi:hypothetical protein